MTEAGPVGGDEFDALEASLSDEDRATLDQLADGIARRRLTSAAIFYLESSRPLGYAASQTMIVLRPLKILAWMMLAPIIRLVWRDPVKWDDVQRLLERRGSIELLVRRLEARA